MDIGASSGRQGRMQMRREQSCISCHRNHLKPLVGILSSLIAGSRIDSAGFIVLFGYSLDLGNGFFELVVHRPVQNWAANVVSQVERTAKYDINPRNPCYLFELVYRQYREPDAFEVVDGRYVVQRIFCLDLYNRQQAIIGLLQILRLRNTADPLHCKRRAEASLARGRKFCGPDD